MDRPEQLATRVTSDEKTAFRVEAAKRDLDMSELLRELIYDHLEEQGHETSRGNSNRTTATATATAD